MTNSHSEPEYQPGEDFAAAMDERDPLKEYRERFLFPKTAGGEECLYLCGHSLGLQPRTAAAYVEQELEAFSKVTVDDLRRLLADWPLWPLTIVSVGPTTEVHTPA